MSESHAAVTISDSLKDIDAQLVELGDAPSSRTLRDYADVYRGVLRGWAAEPPTPEVREALLESVQELRERVLSETTPTPPPPAAKTTT